VPRSEARQGRCIHCHSVFPALLRAARVRSLERGRALGLPAAQPRRTDLERDTRRAWSRCARIRRRARRDCPAIGPAPAPRRSRRAPISRRCCTISMLGRRARLEIEREARRALFPSRSRQAEARDAARVLWRPSWAFTPEPGFGRQRLTAEARALGLLRRLRVPRHYLVNWGRKARYGREAERAGLCAGDVFHRGRGQAQFASVDHFTPGGASRARRERR
jgi:hypothetical protein